MLLRVARCPVHKLPTVSLSSRFSLRKCCYSAFVFVWTSVALPKVRTFFRDEGHFSRHFLKSMAVLMMGDDEGNMTFHDFLGISSEDSAAVVAKDSAGLGDARATEASASASVGAPSCARGPVTPVSNSSDIASERRTGDHFDGVQLHSSKSDISVAQISNRVWEKKRRNTDSGFMGSARDRMHLTGVDSAESSRLVKMFQNEMGREQGRSNRDRPLSFSMQPPKRTSTPVILQQPSRPELVVSGEERSLPMNAGPLVHYPSHFGESPPYMDKTSLKKYSDTTLAGTSTCISPAADEGSRTGTESGNPPRRCFLTSPSQQMTIFYAGQAHVFDDVHPNKADEIMTLAGSSGGSWSMTYSPTSSVRQSSSEAYAPCRENEAGVNNMKFSQDMRSRLVSFQSSYQGAGTALYALSRRWADLDNTWDMKDGEFRPILSMGLA
ncbi:hypothetical protein ACLOJK_031880 [Asimina triloba]